MFIRRKTVKRIKTGSISVYFQLVELIQTRVLVSIFFLHIGPMDISEDERKILSMVVDRLIKGQPRQGRFKLEFTPMFRN